ncbi:MAG TPA: DNA repair protein RecN [Caldisericia bacterium]|nr:DNA repair protein RecN [Caldisericia bacterium]
MIKEIHIHRFILSRDILLIPGEGLNVFSGETGAGKTLILNAIRFGLGDSTNKEQIYHPSESPHVQITFAIPREMHHNEDEFPYTESEWVCERYLSSSGKNRTKINGVMVPIKEYKRILKKLISIHGQHDTSHLFSKKNQLQLFDRFFGKEFSEHLSFIQKNRNLYLHSKEELLAWQESEKERINEIDFITYQINEIEAAKLNQSEEESLMAERDILANSQRIIETLSKIQQLFNEANRQGFSIEQTFHRCIQLLSSISDYTPNLKQSFESLQTCSSILKDLLHDWSRERELIESNYNLQRLDQVLSRIDLIQNLKRKYGNSIAEISSTQMHLKDKLQNLEQAQNKRDHLSHLLNDLEQSLSFHASELSFKRKSLKSKFEEEVSKELADLGMDKIRFEVSLDMELRDSVSSLPIDQQNVFLHDNGIDSLSFLISTNPGQALLPLAKIASGGELSRIMLAIQSMLGKVDQTPSLVFDEIDTGIGGQIAHSIGDKLQSLATNHQLICITHLPQIAAKAHVHFNISKNTTKDHTFIQLNRLNEEERIKEISRMIGGNEDSEISYMHAKEMLNRGKHE